YDGRDTARLPPVFTTATALAVVVVVPVLHEQAAYVITLLLEQPGSGGRIHAAGHADDDAACGRCGGGVHGGRCRRRGCFRIARFGHPAIVAGAGSPALRPRPLSSASQVCRRHFAAE